MIERPRFHDLEHKTRFTFVRHGESEANKRNIIQGHSDSPLSEAGREHARAAGQWLADRQIDLVFTSPLSRSLETANIIAREIAASAPAILEELIELNTGAYSGRSLRDSSKEDPEAFKSFLLQYSLKPLSLWLSSGVSAQAYRAHTPRDEVCHE